MRAPDPGFTFKRFHLAQDRCAMKVTTDACVFGAWLAERPVTAARILDIGTGTGLLACLLAQKKSAARIEAVEIDAEAAGQARENIAASPWAARVSVVCADARDWAAAQPFDLLMSNPPFYERDLASPDAAVNRARHGDTLRFADLLALAEKHVVAGGSLAVLLPEKRADEFAALAAAAGWFPDASLRLRPSPAHPVLRVAMILVRGRAAGEKQELIIRGEDGRYTEPFVELLREYYLYL